MNSQSNKKTINSFFNFNDGIETDDDDFNPSPTPYNSDNDYDSDSDSETKEILIHNDKHTCDTSDKPNFCDCYCTFCCDFRYQHGFLFINDSNIIELMSVSDTQRIINKFNRDFGK
jgi:hypothetical protein